MIKTGKDSLNNVFVEAASFHITDGILYLLDENADITAAFLPGQWRYVVREKALEEDA
jgi:hypothetical protein